VLAADQTPIVNSITVKQIVIKPRLTAPECFKWAIRAVVGIALPQREAS
jgi:hypothetical protein